MAGEEDRTPRGGPHQTPKGAPHATRLGAAAALLAASVLLSRVVGYVRDIALADQVGVGAEADAYYAAFQIPDLLNYLLAQSALSIAFLPLYTRAREERGEAAASRLLATVLGSLGALAFAATAVLWWRAPELVGFLFGGFDEPTRQLTVRLTRIVLPAQVFFITGGVIRAALMSEGRFLAQALSPLLYNGAIVAGGIAMGSAEGFAWGVLAGAIIGPWAVPTLDFLRDHRVRVRIALFDRDFLAYLWLALPLMLGVSLVTVDEWYDKILGDELASGTVAALGFARKLMQAPVAVIGQAAATAALPTLSALYVAGRQSELHRTLLRTLQASVSLGVLAAAGTWAVAVPLVAVMFRHGNFSNEAATLVAELLAILALGIPGWIVQQVSVRAFYAREDTWRPMFLGTGIALLALPTYIWMRDEYGAAGLAWSGAIAITVNAAVTLAWVRIRYGGPDLRPLLASVLRAGAIAGVAGLLARASVSSLPSDDWTSALLALLAGGAAFGVVAGVGVAAFGDESLRGAAMSLVRRLRGSRAGSG